MAPLPPAPPPPKTPGFKRSLLLLLLLACYLLYLSGSRALPLLLGIADKPRFKGAELMHAIPLTKLLVCVV